MRLFNFSAIIALVLCGSMVSCENELDLPEEGSIADVTPPVAGFNFVGGEDFDDFLDFQFGNLSTGAINFQWTFGDGTTSEDFEPIHTYPGEGIFTVTLESSDALGVVSTFTQDIEIIMPDPPSGLTPDILEAGFDLGNDSRDAWRNSDLGGVLQITSSNGFFTGTFGAKLPPSGDRIGYQVIGEFTPNRDYILSYVYTFRDQVDTEDGKFTVAVTTPLTSPSDLDTNVVEFSEHFESASGTGNLIVGTIMFNSGNNTELAIYFFNELDEAYVDMFDIELVE